LLIKKGAEAYLYTKNWYGKKVLIKKRIPKTYRRKELDFRIRNHRTIHEAKMMHEAKIVGVPTPTIYMVDTLNTTIIMDYIPGQQVKQALATLSRNERINVFHRIGVLVGRLHKRGIIHGDLTTSNFILTHDSEVIFIDFGLAEFSEELENKGVDLHLMKRALSSTHYKYINECFSSFVDGYADEIDTEILDKTLRKVREIESRGRYISKRLI
jgi:TP53 regulating kinase-like protein